MGLFYPTWATIPNDIKDTETRPEGTFFAQLKIIVLDLHLPHVSGKEILKQIQADERLKNTRVIVATADARTGEMLHKTADLVLLKPVSINQLIGLANRLR
jgi:CheY-like chemotaxis protein